MPAIVRYDEQYCPIARALDVLGDRWTLLVLRELIAGNRRFTDLRTNLPGVTPAILTQRLRTLTEQGLVRTVPMPAPSTRTTYEITDRGREAVPVMRALVRFGMPLLEPTDGRPVRGWTAVNACVAAYYYPVAAEGVDERYLFRVDDEEYVLSSVRGGGHERDPDLILESDAALWVDIRQRTTTVRDALASKRLHTLGPRAALRHLQRIFQLDARHP
jgi:DNA-binding HxlR family transcriptional regulator